MKQELLIISNILSTLQCSPVEAQSIYNRARKQISDGECTMEYAVAMELAKHC